MTNVNQKKAFFNILVSLTIILAIATTTTATPLNDSTVIYHSMHLVNLTHDDSGNGYDLVNKGVDVTTGIIGDAGFLNRSEKDKFTSLRSFDMNTNNFTISLWVYHIGDNTGEQAFFGSNFTGYQPVQWGKGNNVATVFLFVSYSGTNFDISSGCGSLDLDAWNHWVLTYNGTDYVVYKNGVAECDIGSTTPPMSSSEMTFGEWQTDDTTTFDGAMDEIWVAARAITPDEVTTLYNGGVGLTWPLGASPICSPNWNCTGYASCNTNDLELCNAVTDENVCNETYSGNYSEFFPQICDFCTPSWSCSNYTSCTNQTSQNCTTVTDAFSCYDFTNLSSDEYAGNYSEFTQACAAPQPPSQVQSTTIILLVNILIIFILLMIIDSVWGKKSEPVNKIFIMIYQVLIVAGIVALAILLFVH